MVISLSPVRGEVLFHKIQYLEVKRASANYTVTLVEAMSEDGGCKYYEGNGKTGIASSV